MPDYIFRLDGFNLIEKRSRHHMSDTIHVAIGLRIDADDLPAQVHNMHDLSDERFYELGFTMGPVTIDNPLSVAVFNYQIVNAGHQDPTTVARALELGTQELAKQVDKIADELITSGDWRKLIIGGIIKYSVPAALSAALPNCDGPVAVDQIRVTGRKLEEWTRDSGRHTERRRYPGTDSPHGCGANSLYDVEWTIIRVSDSPSPLEEGSDHSLELMRSPLAVPAVASWGENRLDILGIGMDGAMWHKVWDRDHWEPSATGWSSLGGLFINHNS